VFKYEDFTAMVMLESLYVIDSEDISFVGDETLYLNSYQII
jgi:hypothetical protein